MKLLEGQGFIAAERGPNRDRCCCAVLHCASAVLCWAALRCLQEYQAVGVSATGGIDGGGGA